MLQNIVLNIHRSSNNWTLQYSIIFQKHIEIQTRSIFQIRHPVYFSQIPKILYIKSFLIFSALHFKRFEFKTL